MLALALSGSGVRVKSCWVKESDLILALHHFLTAEERNRLLSNWNAVGSPLLTSLEATAGPDEPERGLHFLAERNFDPSNQ